TALPAARGRSPVERREYSTFRQRVFRSQGWLDRSKLRTNERTCSTLQGEEIMNRLLERNPMHCTGLARGCSAHSVTSSENGALSVERITGVPGSPSRLPPTRAARSPRSRGVFLNRWKRAAHSDKA